MYYCIQATDRDQDRSGLVEYSVPADSPLSVGPYNGTVYTRVALDFEKQQVLISQAFQILA